MPILKLFFVVLFLSVPFGVLGNDSARPLFSLDLQCVVEFRDFEKVEHILKVVDVRLSQIKHKPGGHVLVAETDHYEFWVMVHGTQSINDQNIVNAFQTAIKHKNSLLFMHALSDVSHSASDLPKRSRVSLVEYHPNSMLEKGELMLECTRVQE